MSKGKYILNKQGDVVETDDLMEWAKWVEESREDSQVAREEVGPYVISTVFLALDYSFGIGDKPVLFESMVFKGEGKDRKPVDEDGMFNRYCTKEEALEGHKKIVEEVKKLIEEKKL